MARFFKPLKEARHEAALFRRRALAGFAIAGSGAAADPAPIVVLQATGVVDSVMAGYLADGIAAERLAIGVDCLGRGGRIERAHAVEQAGDQPRRGERRPPGDCRSP